MEHILYIKIHYLKRIWLSILLIYIIVGCSHNIHTTAQKTNPIYNSKIDTIGIIITQVQFDQLVQKLIMEAMDTNSTKDTSFYINFARVINTIEEENLFDKYKTARDLYYKSVFKKTISILKCEFYRGSAFYCPDYDLFLGGVSLKYQNSRYHIIQ